MALPVRSIAPWLTASERAAAGAVIERAYKDIGILEMPLGSNRSPRIDEYMRAVHSPEGGSWCAAAFSAWWREAGVTKLPFKVGSASCDAWMRWGMSEGLWSKNPALGAAVLYGVPGDAQHIGLVVRITPLILSVEGNVGAGRNVTNNGVLCDLKSVAERRDVLGYIHLPK